MKTELARPCIECPFRLQHMPGWLGPWDAGDLIRHVHADGRFPCHRTIPKNSPETLSEDDPRYERLQACAGAALHMNRAIKRSRDPVMSELQQKLKDAAADLVQTVFQWPQDFIAHHTQDIGEWIKKRKDNAA